MTTVLSLLTLLAGLQGCQPAGSDRIFECVETGSHYVLVLPAEFTVARSWPALIILHGDGRNHRTLIENEGTRASLLRARSILVLPDGGRSWWRDETTLLAILDSVAAKLPIDAKRIGCSGWSMGGYGSLRLATHHPERFAMWGGMIGLVDYPNAAYPDASNYRVPALFGDRDQWPAADPLRDTGRLQGKAIWFATAADAFDAAMNRELDRTLNEKKIPHTFEVIEGRHDFAAVAVLLPKLLDFFDQAVQ